MFVTAPSGPLSGADTDIIHPRLAFPRDPVGKLTGKLFIVSCCNSLLPRWSFVRAEKGAAT